MASGRDGGPAASENEEPVEVSGRTVEEATEKALRLLGLSRDDVEVQVIHAGTPGRLLGFGAEPARVRVTPAAGAVAAAAPAAPAAPAATPPVEAESEEEEEEEEAEGRSEIDLAGEAELGRLMLVELLNRMGMPQLRVDVVDTDPITLNILGGDVADLIGRRGENLRALQFILGLMMNKQLRRHIRVVVDVDGYRARREELLRNMAQRFAHRVRSTMQPMPLEAMPPNERRIVHLTLAEDPDVMTESVGEGEARRVVIKPRR